MIRITSILTFLILSISAIAQDDKAPPSAELAIVARPFQDSIWLRWAVSKSLVWSEASPNGYVLEKAELTNPNSGDYSGLKFNPVNGGLIKPWDLEKWKREVERLDQVAEEEAMSLGVAYELLFGDESPEEEETLLPPLSGNFDAFKDAKSKVEMRYVMAMAFSDRLKEIAEAYALRTTDKDVEPGKTYVYKISLKKNPTMFKAAPAYVKVKAENFGGQFDTSSLNIEEGDQELKLSWGNIKGVAVYNVDKSEDGISFDRVTKSPVTIGSLEETARANHHDEELENYKKYHYRLYGITPFAESFMIAEVSGMPRDKTPPPSVFLEKPEHDPDREEVALKWSLMGDLPPDFRGYKLSRSHHADGPFEDLMPDWAGSETQSYIDKGFNLDGRNFYLVTAVDTAGNQSYSRSVFVALADIIPPVQPTGLEGEMDTLGNVAIKWIANVENDLLGYRIYRSNSIEHEFVAIAETFNSETLDSLSNAFFDTLAMNTLTEEVFYRIRALDFNQNESEFQNHSG